jgi:hypothetical protein
MCTSLPHRERSERKLIPCPRGERSERLTPNPQHPTPNPRCERSEQLPPGPHRERSER